MLALLCRFARSLLLRPLEHTLEAGPMIRVGSASYHPSFFDRPRPADDADAQKLVREDIKAAADRGGWDE